MINKKNVIIFLIISLIFLSGCKGPDAKLELESKTIYISNEQYSSPIKISIIKKDNEKAPVFYLVNLYSPNPEFMKFFDISNNEITSINTLEQSLLKDDKISYEFRVWAKKIEGQGTVPYHAKIELWYKDKILDSEIITINVI